MSNKSFWGSLDYDIKMIFKVDKNIVNKNIGLVKQSRYQNGSDSTSFASLKTTSTFHFLVP